MEEKQSKKKNMKSLIDVSNMTMSLPNILTFAYEKYNGTYTDVADSIDKNGLKRPTMAEAVSLMYSAFFSNGKEFSEIKQMMRNQLSWAFTGTLYIPDKGAYIQDNPRIRWGRLVMDESELIRFDESELIKKLEADGPNVRFVPFGFKTGEMSPLELAKNPYMVALAGEEGAEKLAKIAEKNLTEITNKYKHKPVLWSFDSVKRPLMRVSALDTFWYFDRLNVYGDSRGDSNAFAFGVKK